MSKKKLSLVVMIVLFAMLFYSLAFAQGVVIKFYGQTGAANIGREIAHKQIFENYEKNNPNVKIDALFFPWEELERKITLAATGENPPDIFYVDCPLLPFFADNGVIAPMTEYYTTEEMNDILPASIEDATWNGEFYGPPESQSAQALFYNKTMFDEAGIQPPVELDKAWTWEEALEVLRKMTKDVDQDGRINIYGLGIVHSPSFYDWGHIVRSNGEKDSTTFAAISPDGLSVKGYLDTPEALEAFNFMADLFNEWKVVPKVPMPDMLQTGKCATVMENESLIGATQVNYPDFEYGITPLPYFKTMISHTGSLHYCLSAKSQYPEETAKLIKYMGGKEASLIMFKYLRQLPALKSVYEEISDYDSYPQQLMRDVLFNVGYVRPRTVGFTEYDALFSKAMSDIIAGANVEKTVERMVNEIERQLNKYRR